MFMRCLCAGLAAPERGVTSVQAEYNTHISVPPANNTNRIPPRVTNLLGFWRIVHMASTYLYLLASSSIYNSELSTPVEIYTIGSTG
jgi:hypothetical protein